MRAVFETLGIQDVVAKSIGSSNPYNMVRATFDALKHQDSPRSVAARRNIKVSDAAGAPRRRRRRSGRRINRRALWRVTEFKTMAKAAKTIKVEQTGSAIRRHHSQRSTLIGLKLNKIGRVTELQDTPAVRGMIAKVQHLVRIVGE